MQISKLKIKNYSNYRDFLIDYVNFKKTNPQWSLGVWKRQLKLKSVSTLTMILKGQRDPGPRLIQSFNQYFKFNEEEKNYFESLVGLQKKVKNISPSQKSRNDSKLVLSILKKAGPPKMGRGVGGLPVCFFIE